MFKYAKGFLYLCTYCYTYYHVLRSTSSTKLDASYDEVSDI